MSYTKRPASEVTTEDLIATIRADRDSFATFEARREFTKRTNADWRVYAPTKWRTKVDGVAWYNFVEEGWL